MILGFNLWEESVCFFGTLIIKPSPIPPCRECALVILDCIPHQSTSNNAMCGPERGCISLVWADSEIYIT